MKIESYFCEKRFWTGMKWFLKAERKKLSNFHWNHEKRPCVCNLQHDKWGEYAGSCVIKFDQEQI